MAVSQYSYLSTIFYEFQSGSTIAPTRWGVLTSIQDSPDMPDTSEKSTKGVIMLNTELTPATSDRVPRSLALRMAQGGSDAFVGAPPQIDNGDEALYADKCGTYTKGILQTGIGLVDLA